MAQKFEINRFYSWCLLFWSDVSSYRCNIRSFYFTTFFHTHHPPPPPPPPPDPRSSGPLAHTAAAGGLEMKRPGHRDCVPPPGGCRCCSVWLSRMSDDMVQVFTQQRGKYRLGSREQTTLEQSDFKPEFSHIRPEVWLGWMSLSLYIYLSNRLSKYIYILSVDVSPLLSSYWLFGSLDI